MCFGPASPDAGVELLRQLFLQCIYCTVPVTKYAVDTRTQRGFTLNLPFLNLEHVINKQLQINIKCTFIFLFLFHVLILKEEKQLFTRCKLLFLIWIQVTVINTFGTITNTCAVARNPFSLAQPLSPPPPPPHQAV